jgi:hypothetical protein
MAPGHPQAGAEPDHLRSASQQITLGQQACVFGDPAPLPSATGSQPVTANDPRPEHHPGAI